MKDCPVGNGVASQLPDYARSAHGNLAEQNRTFGPVRGVSTAAQAGTAAAAASPRGAARSLAEKSGCLACHGIASKVVGPGLRDIAAKYKGMTGAEASLAAKVKAGGTGVWGEIPMPPNAQIQDDDIRTLVRWVLDGAGQ